MGNSLLTGVSGLLAHSRMLDVTGNNLANVSTTAYKAQRAMFADMVYETIRSASHGTGSGLGGVNPSQIGSGAITSHVDRNFQQSSLELTGGAFDLAVEGSGFFVVHDGQSDLVTRAGTFGLDADQFLVDQATGFKVQRTGNVGESIDGNPGFQVAGDTSIRVPIGSTVLGAVSTLIDMNGNLDAQAQGPRAAVLTSAAPFVAAGVPATVTTLLNDLDGNRVPYGPGDSILLTGVDHDGSPVSTSLAVDGSSTMGDMLAAIDGLFGQATASLDAQGNLAVAADVTGPSSLILNIADAATNTGGAAYDLHALAPTTAGSDGDIIRTPVEFFDSLGRTHVLNLQFQRAAGNNTWNLAAELPASSGTLANPQLGEIRFNDDGSFQQITSNATGSIPVTMLLSGLAQPMTLQLNLADEDGSRSLTQAASGSSLLAEADGYGAGTIYATSVSQDGTIMGLGTNGRAIPIAQMSVATFLNNKGLMAVGDNHFAPTVNSGPIQTGTAQSAGRGRILAGQLESSNVDLAYEFTRLIVAQRGFSANARTITVTDEVLQEVTNIIR